MKRFASLTLLLLATLALTLTSCSEEDLMDGRYIRLKINGKPYRNTNPTFFWDKLYPQINLTEEADRQLLSLDSDMLYSESEKRTSDYSFSFVLVLNTPPLAGEIYEVTSLDNKTIRHSRSMMMYSRFVESPDESFDVYAVITLHLVGTVKVTAFDSKTNRISGTFALHSVHNDESTANEPPMEVTGEFLSFVRQDTSVRSEQDKPFLR